jgi:hypothetical protein
MTEKKVKISGRMLSAVKDAEIALAREEAKGLEDTLPEGHPLKEEVDKQKSLLGGDLSGLPPGHPLLVALESARKNIEAQKAFDAEREKARTEIKKAKKIDPNDVKREVRKQEDEVTDKRRQAAKVVNERIESVLKDVKVLFDELVANEELLNTDPFSRVKAARLRRLLFATERGISDCRIMRI